MLLILLSASAPSDAGNDLQQWTSLNLTHPISDKLDLSLMVQGRFGNDFSEVDAVVVRPDVGYHLSDHVKLNLGYDYFDKPQSGENSENRVWQQLSLNYRAGDLGFANRVRIEQRIIDHVNGVTVRARYRLRLTHPLNDPDWQVIASNEILTNLNEEPGGPSEGFDENRLFGGLGFRITPHLRLETGYQWQLKENSSDHILMLEFFFRTDGL